MDYVYVLWSKEDRKFYIGYTKDLARRLQEHENRQCHTTLRMKNPKFIFCESFVAESDAKRREEYFKTTKGKKTLKLMLRDSLRQ